MKKILCAAALLGSALVSAGAYAFTTSGFSNPFGVAVDLRTNFIYVSNVNGPLAAKDGRGFISRLKGDGSIDNLRFIDGASRAIELNAPKGMAVVGTTLYVCDIDRLRAFDTTYGNLLFNVNFGNLPVQHFYDVKLGPDGALYVTDGPGNRIYRVDIPRQHEVTTFTQGESLGQPHAVVWSAARQAFIVAGWSSGQVTAYGRNGKSRPLPAVFLRTLEGMDIDDRGNIYVSSVGLGGIYRIDSDFAVNSFVTGMDSPVGIVFHKAAGRIITASLNGNTVESVPVHADGPTRPLPVMEVSAPPAPEPAPEPEPTPAPAPEPAPQEEAPSEPEAPAPESAAETPSED